MLAPYIKKLRCYLALFVMARELLTINCGYGVRGTLGWTELRLNRLWPPGTTRILAEWAKAFVSTPSPHISADVTQERLEQSKAS